VRRALLLLEQEGRILRRRGSGTYAKTSRVHTSLAFDVQSRYGEAPAFGREPGTEVSQAVPTKVPASLRAAHPELGDSAFGIQRTRSEQGEPYQVAVTYVPEAIARRHGLRRGSGSNAGLAKLARDVRGVEQVTTAVAADAVSAKELKVAIGSPLLRIRAALLNAAGDVLAVDESLMRPDRAHLHDRLRRDRGGRGAARWQLKSA
jgi:DNA-binding GntR family transcriptional regulator